MHIRKDKWLGSVQEKCNSLYVRPDDGILKPETCGRAKVTTRPLISVKLCSNITCGRRYNFVKVIFVICVTEPILSNLTPVAHVADEGGISKV